MLKNVHTRFRAYQLGTEGASFSYFADDCFTLIEGRLSEVNKATLFAELKYLGRESIDRIHITSWDQDHCSPNELIKLLEIYEPKTIEYPGYVPHTETAWKALSIINDYSSSQYEKGRTVHCRRIDPDYIDSLVKSSELGYGNVIYHPKYITPNTSNDNSTVKLFRNGCFNVASLGDVESSQISSMLRRSKIFQELDILILAHHGANNDFTSSAFLKNVKPTVAVCSSNYDNQFDHPDPKIRNLLDKNRIPLFTTKTGDIIIESIGNHSGNFQVYNLIAGSSKVASTNTYTSKKKKLLSKNMDSIRNMYNPGRR